MFKIQTLKAKILIATAVIISILFALQVFYVSPMIEQRSKDEQDIFQNSLADQIVKFINIDFQEYIVELEILAESPTVVSMNKMEIDGILSQMNTLTQFFDYFFVTDTEGRWVSYPSKQHLVGKKIKNDYWVKEVIAKNKTHYLDLHLAKTIDTLVSGFATPIRNSQGQILGILRGVITVSDDNALFELVKSFNFSQNGYVFLVDSKGRALAHPDFKLTTDSLERSGLINLPPVQKSLSGESGIIEYTYNNKSYNASYRPVETTGWGLVVQQPSADILLRVKDEVASISSTYFVFFLVLLLLLAFIAYKTLNPLTLLLGSLKNQDFKSGADYPDNEIGHIAKEIEGLFYKMGEAKKDLGEVLENQEKHIAERTRELSESNEKLTHQINEREKAEKHLRESEEQYRSLFENATDLIQVVQADGQLLYVNPSWCSALGYTEEEARRLKVFDIIHPDCDQTCELVFSKTLAEGASGLIETSFISKDGKKINLQGSANCKYINGEPTFVQCIFQNVTERQLLEEELAKMHKLESVGVLAGGIAHDFNNILTAIVGNLSLARAQSEPGGKVYTRLEEAEKASLRAKDLTQQLLTFSKGGEPIKATTSLSEIMKDSCSFVLRGSNVKCNFSLPKELSLVEVDEGQISQVMHNLVINADQAMPDGGTIKIHAENVHLSSEKTELLNAGNYVLVTLADQGAGISAKHIEKIFDPYFSTKHKGHGLGLATAYSIIKKHGGLLQVESKQGEGSVFSFYLPASGNQDIGLTSAKADIHLGKGSVLLMDDEEHVREVGREMLAHLGYQVTPAANGQQAIEIYSTALQKNTPFDIVILDLTIPGGLGGKETIEKLLEIDPSVTAIVSSGYANDPVMANHKQYGFSGVVPKPYRIEELSNVLKSLLQTN